MEDTNYENKIKELLGSDSFNKGRHLVNNVRYLRNLYYGFYHDDKYKNHSFWVKSESFSRREYLVRIKVNNDEIIDYSCNCPQFESFSTCKHIAACFLAYPSEIFPNNSEVQKVKTKEFLNNFYNPNVKANIGKIKERVLLEIELDLDNLLFKLYLGTKKMYVLNTESKFYDFFDSFENNEKYIFGKSFTYDPETNYLSDDDISLLNYLKNNDRRYFNYYDRRKYNELSTREFLILLEKLKNREFKVGEIIINNIINDFPGKFNLVLDNNQYLLKIDNYEKIKFYNDRKFAIVDNTLFIVPLKYKNVLDNFEKYDINELIFDKDLVDIFKNGLLQDIKTKIDIDENITDIKISKEPTARFYFDLLDYGIVCNFKINYDDEIIDFFDNQSKLVRDKEYENKCLEEILKYNFIIDKDKIILSDLDDIGAFLDEGISLLNQKYDVFTSKKMDNTKILKKSHIESSFSIGQDGILSYNFNSDDIDNNEILSIVSSIKNKKKYYRLKNGNLLNLLDENLINLGGMINDLNIKSLDEDGNVVLPKYKAFYIDSLKRNKYKSIKTNNSFDSFIDNFNKYKNTKFDFRESDNKLLREYQRDGVLWLYTLYKCDFGGILADEMGLGKSLQAITFLRKVIEEKPNSKVLIVCPTSLVYNWKKEFDKFGSDLKYVTVHDNKERRKEVINNRDKYNIFITSYGLIKNDNDEYEKIDFEVCIIDEAQAIKNYQAETTKEVKKIKAKFKLALTGTPIENSVIEMWSIFDFLMPGYLNNIDNFRSVYGIKDIDEDAKEIINKLKAQVKPFILRRKKVDVISDLPEKIEDNIYLELAPIQKSLYLKELNDTKKKMEELMKTEGFNKARFEILQLLTKLRQICIDPGVHYDNYKETPVKMERLLDMVHNLIDDGHKILIFSTFKTVIDKVEELFKKENITSYTITGEVPSKKRMELVEKFNSDNTNCFLITLKSGGTGLNLTGADTVIHLDIWWNPQAENQATDRAHRIGQTNKVSVMKLVTKGTIEEKIIELQEKKKYLANNLLEGNDDSKIINSLTEKDVKNLLSFSGEEL